ncbi:MAG: hypothetical protein PHO32_08280 [Candidatus Cloacimonetes bacterium]|nr:hypothetical protein [Candidatus Cloacimonadota bacterium]
MIRKIIQPQSESYILHIPKEYLNREIEILMVPLDSEADPVAKSIKAKVVQKTAGILKSRNIAPNSCPFVIFHSC